MMLEWARVVPKELERWTCNFSNKGNVEGARSIFRIAFHWCG